MLTTVMLASCISVQGWYVKTLSNGAVVVRVGRDTFAGRPVAAAA